MQLRKVSNAEKHIAIILANYPNRDSRLGNGVGLDTPASVVKFLHRMQTDGYDVGEIPEDGDALIRELQAGITNDEEQSYGKPIAQGISSEELGQVLSRLPDSAQERLTRQ